MTLTTTLNTVLDDETSRTLTNSRSEAKRIVTALVGTGKPFAVTYARGFWEITVGDDFNHLPRSLGRWMDK